MRNPMGGMCMRWKPAAQRPRPRTDRGQQHYLRYPNQTMTSTMGNFHNATKGRLNRITAVHSVGYT